MSKLTKRLTAMLLSGMLVIGSVPGAVLAADAQEDLGQTSEVAEEVYEEDTSEAPASAGETSVESYSEEATEEETLVEYYTVTLDANGGYFENEWDDAIGDYAQQAVTVTRQIPVGGTVASIPVYKTESDGQTMTFAGWSLEPDGEIVSQTKGEYVPVDNCVLYAVWQVADGGIGQEDTAQETEVADESGDAGAEDESESAQESEDVEAVEETETEAENTEETESDQEFEETTEDRNMDQETAEDTSIQEDTVSDEYIAPKEENEQDAAPAQEEIYSDEEEKEIGEESSGALQKQTLKHQKKRKLSAKMPRMVSWTAGRVERI